MKTRYERAANPSCACGSDGGRGRGSGNWPRKTAPKNKKKKKPVKEYLLVDDLDYGYWHVPIYPPHQKYLGIHFVNPIFIGLGLSWLWV